MKKILIIGAGSAGLTAAYELLKQNIENPDFAEVIILEESDCYGGMSRTVNYNGNRMDMGGHSFFSKSDAVNNWWQEILPMQGAPSKDDIMLGRVPLMSPGGPGPEEQDAVMLSRKRFSRIYFRDKFFDYPIRLNWQTIKNMGLLTAVSAGFSYLWSCCFKKKEDSLENFYTNRFGKKLYSMFFENYTKNLWGRSPKDISADWGAQREASFVETFKYPKYGPGQLWEITADKIKAMGGRFIMDAKVVGVELKKGRVYSVNYEKRDMIFTETADVVISSMPVKELVAGLEAPTEVKRIAEGLPYRDYMTVGLLVKSLKLKNKTKIKTVGNIVPDTWIYVNDSVLKLGRMQIYNNRSPYMVKDPEGTVSVGLEYFCDEGDELWSKSDDEFVNFAVDEFIRMGCIDSKLDIIDSHVERVKKAYPACFDTYNEFDTVKNYLNTIDNLYCIGHNGQHRYYNTDHSMETAFEAVNCIVNNISDKTRIWNVNTEKEYHEEN